MVTTEGPDCRRPMRLVFERMRPADWPPHDECKLILATWNINSVRLRIELVGAFLDEHQPDVLCLQEIKCPEQQFPYKAFHEPRLPAHPRHMARRAITASPPLSKKPFRCDLDARPSAARAMPATPPSRSPTRGGEIELHNFYVPAGGDEPDPAVNEKFAHKLAFLDEMRGWLTGKETDRQAILVGDLNIAPHENDVWSHKQLLKVVSHTPVETEGLETVRAAGNWVDAVRHFVPVEEKLYTWWSYRAAELGGLRSRPPARSYLGDAPSGATPEGHRGLARRPWLGAAFRPRPGHRPDRMISPAGVSRGGRCR